MASIPSAKPAKISFHQLHWIGKIGVIYTSIAAIITDILRPLGNYALYITFFLATIAIILLTIYICFKKNNHEINIKLSIKLKGFWFYPIFSVFILSSIIFFASYYINKDKPNGIMAENFNLVQLLQKDFGIIGADISEIAKSSKNLEKKADNIVTTLDTVSEKQDNLIDLAGNLKKETSEDPRKELANMGLEWSVHGLTKVIQSGDLANLKLFLEAGMDINVRDPSLNNLSPFIYLFKLQPKNWEEIFKFAISKGLNIHDKIYQFDGASYLKLGSNNEIMAKYFDNNATNVLYSFSDIVLLSCDRYSNSIFAILKEHGADTEFAITKKLDAFHYFEESFVNGVCKRKENHKTCYLGQSNIYNFLKAYGYKDLKSLESIVVDNLFKKEILSKGLTWTVDDFEKCIAEYDTSNIELYIAGGMNINSKNFSGISPFFSIFTDLKLGTKDQNNNEKNKKLMDNKFKRFSVLDFAVKNGFDINKKEYELSTSLINAVRHYEEDDLPLFISFIDHQNNSKVSFADIVMFLSGRNPLTMVMLEGLGADINYGLKLQSSYSDYLFGFTYEFCKRDNKDDKDCNKYFNEFENLFVDKFPLVSNNYYEINKKYINSLDSGDAESQYRIGKFLYLNSYKEKGVELLLKASQQNHFLAKAYILSLRTDKNNPTLKQEVDEAIKQLENIDSDDAYNILGDIYSNNITIPRDYNKSLLYYKKALNNGSAEAMFNIALLYLMNPTESASQKKDSMDLLQKSAEKEFPRAQHLLGLSYQTNGESQEYKKKGAEYLKMAAANGHLEAQDTLGICYKNGIGVEKSFKSAVYWFKKAADQGHLSAQYHLGECYLWGEHNKPLAAGDGNGRYWDKALKYFNLASDKGYALAQNALGFCYENRIGVGTEYDAVILYEKAANQGDPTAQCNLAKCYERGLGTEKNLIKAKEWYQKAAKQGSALAKEQLAKLEKQIQENNN